MTLSGGVVRADEPTFDFNIPEQRADDALILLGEQADATVLFQYDMATQHDANRLQGEYTLPEAVGILLADSGLKAEFGEQGHLYISVDEKHGKGNDMNVKKKAGLLATLAALFTGANAQEIDDPQTQGQEEETGQALEEIIVTGTNIRGAGPVGSPFLSIDRQEIELTGLSTAQDLLRALPQNFGGGANEITTSVPGTGNDAGLNTGRGSSINLRGLGVASTLTLVNGRRVALSSFGTGADISGIPLAAIDRIEVLADGASAIYGADAVGGVVNFVLRDDYDEAETSLRYGSVTDGELDEFQFSQTFGKTWDKGNVLAVYEFRDRGFLFSEDRTFASSNDLSVLGGDDFRRTNGNPGTIEASGQTFAIPLNQDGSALTPGDLVAGTSNPGNAREGTTLLPEQENHSVFVSASYRPIQRLKLFLEGRYSNRSFESRAEADEQGLTVPSSNPFFVDPIGGLSSIRVQYSFVDDLGPITSAGDAENSSIVGGGTFEFANEWRAELSGTYSLQSDTSQISGQTDRTARNAALADLDPSTALNVFGDGANTNPATIQSLQLTTESVRDFELHSINGIVDGPLFRLPAGHVGLALGGEYREEEFDSTGKRSVGISPLNVSSEETFKRDVFAVFGELRVPVFSEENAVAGIERLEISAAVRYEDYSDFGSTTNPKLGAVWTPIKGLDLRGSYGTSFRAPSLVFLDQSGGSAFFLDLPDASAPDMLTTTLAVFGNTPGLGPEEATHWTAGFNYYPEQIPGFSFRFTFFDIEYEDRIDFGVPAVALGTVFDNEDIFDPLIDRVGEFDPAYVASFFSPNPPVATFFDLTGGAGPGAAEAVVDGRRTNVSITNVSGFDVIVQLNFETDFGDLGFSLNSSFVSDFERAITSTAPLIDFVDTVGQPVDFRLRGSVNWSSGAWSAAGFVNYLDSYEESTDDDANEIGSYTTADVRLAFDTRETTSTGLLSNTVFALAISNFFDEDPPFFNNPVGVGFDPEKSSPLGRFIAFQVNKSW